MSLQIWLPLDKNLLNKGLNPVSVTNNGATIDNNGKIGKCYSFNGINNYLKGSYTSSATISFTCWVYLTLSIGGKHVFDARTASGVGYQPIYLTNTSIQIGCSGSTYATFYYTWPIQTWFHISVVHTATTGKCYVNGNLIGTSTAAKGVDVGICNFTIGSRCNQANYSNIKINDVRIYDHALSLKEIKEISKALILHYPLDNFNLINKDTLVENSYIGSNGNVASTSNWFATDYIPIIPGQTYQTLDLSHGGSGTYIGLYNSSKTKVRTLLLTANENLKFTAETTEVFTRLSIRNFDNELLKAGFYEISNIISDCSGYLNNGELYSYNTTGSIEYDINTPKYNICTFINSDNNTTNTPSGTRYIYGHCLLTNPSVMSVAFWCKPLGGYGGNSGQGQFCTTSYEYNNVNVGSDFTITAMNHRDSTVDINDSTGSMHCRVSFSPTLNEWHHYAIIYDGQVGKVYKDAILSSTAQFSTPQKLGSFIGVVIGFSKAGGVWRSNKTYYSDFRVYATALSESDILKLYHTSALADRPSNLYSYDFTLLNNKKLFSRKNISFFKDYTETSTINPNIMPNSVNMALGSANPGTGTWRLAGTSNMSRSRVAITDAPIGICYGFQSSGIQNANTNDTSCYGIDSFPFEANTDYVISFWARKTSGTLAYAGFSIYSCTYGEGSDIRFQQQYYITALPLDGSWIRCWKQFKTNSSTNRNIYIGITTGTQSATAQMCAVKIEKGILLTQWIPKLTDENYEQYRIKDNMITINRLNYIFANSFYEI